MIARVTKDDKIKRFCPEHISYLYGGILMKIHINVHLNEKQCHANEPGGLEVKCQGHTKRLLKNTCLEQNFHMHGGFSKYVGTHAKFRSLQLRSRSHKAVKN
jgi:hypothetical protein